MKVWPRRPRKRTISLFTRTKSLHQLSIILPGASVSLVISGDKNATEILLPAAFGKNNITRRPAPDLEQDTQGGEADQRHNNEVLLFLVHASKEQLSITFTLLLLSTVCSSLGFTSSLLINLLEEEELPGPKVVLAASPP